MKRKTEKFEKQEERYSEEEGGREEWKEWGRRRR